MTKANITKLTAIILMGLAPQTTIAMETDIATEVDAASVANTESLPELLSNLNDLHKEITWGKDNWRFMKEKFNDTLGTEYSPKIEKYGPVSAGAAGFIAALSASALGYFLMKGRGGNADKIVINDYDSEDDDIGGFGGGGGNRGNGGGAAARSFGVKKVALSACAILSIIGLPIILYKGTEALVDKSERYKEVFTKFVVNWSQHKQYTPQELHPFFDLIYREYQESAHPKKYLSSMAIQATKIIRKITEESTPPGPNKPSIIKGLIKGGVVCGALGTTILSSSFVAMVLGALTVKALAIADDD